MPVEATVLPDGNYYLPKTDEVIPAEMATPSPDDRFHHCYYPMFSMANEFDSNGAVWERKLKTRCFFAPMNTIFWSRYVIAVQSRPSNRQPFAVVFLAW